MPSSTTPGSPIIDSSRAAMSTWPSPRVDRLGTPKAPAIRFARAMTFVASWFTHLLRPARLLAPRYGSDHLRGQRGLLLPGFQRDEPVAGYNYSSDWTPLLTGLSPARMAASLAAPTPASESTRGAIRKRSNVIIKLVADSSPLTLCRAEARGTILVAFHHRAIGPAGAKSRIYAGASLEGHKVAGGRPPAPRPNNGLATRPHIWGATPCIKDLRRG